MIMKAKNVDGAQQIARLHLVRAVARALLLDSRPRRMSVPAFVPAGLGSTLPLKAGKASDAELAAQVLRYDLAGADSPAADRARRDLRLRGESRLVTKREQEQNQVWLQKRGRRDRTPEAHTYLVKVPALTVETRDGHTLTVGGARLELTAEGPAYAAVRTQTRMPVKKREGRWYWDSDVSPAVRDAWAELAESLCVTAQTLREEQAA